MSTRHCLALILAGGQGTRLSPLTTAIPKPALPFGGSYRLIDFSLSNCHNSGIDAIGILHSRRSFSPELFAMSAQPLRCRIYSLPPSSGFSYSGTANAVWENLSFIESFSPATLLILSGDHVYKMNYNALLAYHQQQHAAATISVIEVPWSEVSRFGIMSVAPDSTIKDFVEKPVRPHSNLASMGVYVFSWPVLKKYLQHDAARSGSAHDFGKNIIPAMLSGGEKLCAYSFGQYWKDVGTVGSLYEAHMDLLSNEPAFTLSEQTWPLYSTLTGSPTAARLDSHTRSLLSSNCCNLGSLSHSVLFSGTYIGAGSQISHSIIMPGAYIGNGARIEHAIIGPGARVENTCCISGTSSSVAVIAENAHISAEESISCP